jgi:ubiquinone/menaquinone biosynthesis C-methylase UbiE
MNNLRLYNLLSNLLYNQFSWSYDFVSNIVSAGLWKKWVLSVLPFISGGKILEIGIGPGHLQIALYHEVNKVVYGFDLSSSMCQMAKRNIVKCNYVPKIVNGTTSHLPYPNAYFDIIVSTFPTATILDCRSLTEISRILNTNGTIVLLPLAFIKRTGFIEYINLAIIHNTNMNDYLIMNLKNTFSVYNITFSSQYIDCDKSRVMVVIGTKN